MSTNEPCPECGVEIQVDENLTEVTCAACGAVHVIGDEVMIEPCPVCGAELRIEGHMASVTCTGCGTTHVINVVDEEDGEIRPQAPLPVASPVERAGRSSNKEFASMTNTNVAEGKPIQVIKTAKAIKSDFMSQIIGRVKKTDKKPAAVSDDLVLSPTDDSRDNAPSVESPRVFKISAASIDAAGGSLAGIPPADATPPPPLDTHSLLQEARQVAETETRRISDEIRKEAEERLERANDDALRLAEDARRITEEEGRKLTEDFRLRAEESKRIAEEEAQHAVEAAQQAADDARRMLEDSIKEAEKIKREAEEYARREKEQIGKEREEAAAERVRLEALKEQQTKMLMEQKRRKLKELALDKAMSLAKRKMKEQLKNRAAAAADASKDGKDGTAEYEKELRDQLETEIKTAEIKARGDKDAARAKDTSPKSEKTKEK